MSQIPEQNVYSFLRTVVEESRLRTVDEGYMYEAAERDRILDGYDAVLANLHKHLLDGAVAGGATPQELMAAAVKAGGTFSDYMQARATFDPPSAEEVALVERARELYHCEGDLELDDLTMVSGCEEPTGDYVLCWKWVDKK
jgi:hypothetical protein